MLHLTTILHRWVDPEFKEEEDMSREDEAGTETEEDVVDDMDTNREVVDNLREIFVHMEDNIVVDIEMEELQPLKAKQ